MTKTRTRKRPARQKVSRSLAGFADARKSPLDLMKDIQTHVVAQGAKNQGLREDHLIHVSEVVKDDACPRRMYYKVSKAERTDPEPPAGHRMELIWAAGNAEHEKWQRWLQEMGELWGHWVCQACGNVVENSIQPETECGVCGVYVWRYDEAHLQDDDYHLVGHSDGAVPRLNTLVEVKSFSVGTVRMENAQLVKDHTHKVDGKTLVDHEGLWNAVKRPLPTHLKQGLFYLWIAKRMGLPYDRIVFIYENKTNQATKPFEVKYSERMIKEHLQVLAEVDSALYTGEPPKRPALFAKDSKPCNACPFRTLCWGDDEEKDRGDSGTAATAEVPGRRPRSRSRTSGREAAVRTPGQAGPGDPEGPRRRHRTRGSGPDDADDRTDSVDRAPRRSIGDGGGGRAVGRSGDGEGEGPRFARRRR